MSQIPICIPSRGRWSEPHTVNNLPQELWPRIRLYVPKEEQDQYQRSYKAMGFTGWIHVVSDYSHGIALKRWRIGQAMADAGHQMFWMMDDDLHFAYREDPESPKLTKMMPIVHRTRYLEMFGTAEQHMIMDPFLCAVGISLRQGNNTLPYPMAINTRCIRCVLFRTEPFMDAVHGRVQVMEDFDVMLQMFEAGWENIVLSGWSQDQKGTGAKGGCSTERTLDVHNASAVRLAELHPGLVRVREKENKTGPEGMRIRKEVTISWKKALKNASNQRR